MKNEITVFSTPTCPWCFKLKDYLKENNIDFTDVNVAADYDSALKMVEKSGQMGVPQIWIGDQVIVGFDKQSIDQELGL